MPLRQPTHADNLYQQAALTSCYRQCLCQTTPVSDHPTQLPHHDMENGCIHPNHAIGNACAHLRPPAASKALQIRTSSAPIHPPASVSSISNSTVSPAMSVFSWLRHASNVGNGFSSTSRGYRSGEPATCAQYQQGTHVPALRQKGRSRWPGILQHLGALSTLTARVYLQRVLLAQGMLL